METIHTRTHREFRKSVQVHTLTSPKGPAPSYKVTMSHLHSHNTYNPETKSQPTLCVSRKLTVFLSHAHWSEQVEAPTRAPAGNTGHATHTWLQKPTYFSTSHHGGGRQGAIRPLIHILTPLLDTC